MSEDLTIDDILNEFERIRIPWPQLALALKLENSIVEKISQQCGGDEAKCLRMVLHNWMSNHESSWEILSLAVMRLPMLRQKGAELYTKYVSKDLTPETVYNYLNDLVDDWFQLGYMLLSSSQKVKEAVSGETESEKRISLIQYWLKSDKLASWELVARKIEDCLPQHEIVAEKIRKNHLPKEEYTPLMKPPSPMPDTELTVKTAFIATQGVDDWYALGRFLKLENEYLQEINDDQSTRSDIKRQRVLEIWIEENDNPNWTNLADALRKMPQHVGKSETIRTKYCKKESTTTDVQPDSLVQPPPVTQTSSSDDRDELVQSLKKQISVLHQEIDDLKAKTPLVHQEAMDIDEEETDAITRLETYFNNIRISLVSAEADFLIVKEQINENQKMLQERSAQTAISSYPAVDIVPMGLINSMEIIAKHSARFKPNEDYVINEKKYGFKLYIPKGSIPQNEIGYVEVYVIYSGPFEFEQNLIPMSSTYCIAFSHDLLVPVTLQIQHSCNITSQRDIEYLSFVSASLTDGPPFKFKAVPEGSFFPGDDYAIIKRQNFSFWKVVGYISQLLWAPFMKKRKREDDEETQIDVKTRLAISYVVSADNARAFNVSINVIPCIRPLHMHHKKMYSTNLIKEDLVEIIDNTLDPASDILRIAITDENGSLNASEPWNGDQTSIGKWNVFSNQTKIQKNQILRQSQQFIPIKIELNWAGDNTKPERVLLKIYILGLTSEFRIQIPIDPENQMKSRRFSSTQSFDIELTDPPDIPTLMDKVAPRISHKWNQLMIHLLSEEIEQSEVENFNRNNSNSLDAIKLMFQKWLNNHTEEATWQKLIESLTKGNVALLERPKTKMSERNKHCVVELTCPGTTPSLDLNSLLSHLYQCLNVYDIDITLAANHSSQAFSMTIVADRNHSFGEKLGVANLTVIVHLYVNFDDVDLCNHCHDAVKKCIQQALSDAKCSTGITLLTYTLK